MGCWRGHEVTELVHLDCDVLIFQAHLTQTFMFFSTWLHDKDFLTLLVCAGYRSALTWHKNMRGSMSLRLRGCAHHDTKMCLRVWMRVSWNPKLKAAPSGPKRPQGAQAPCAVPPWASLGRWVPWAGCASPNTVNLLTQKEKKTRQKDETRSDAKTVLDLAEQPSRRIRTVTRAGIALPRLKAWKLGTF